MNTWGGIFLEFGLLPTSGNIEKYIGQIVKEHPCSKTFFIGKSVLGRKIPVLSLGDPYGSVLFAGATHGSEWLTSLVLLRFYDEIATAFEKGESLFEIDLSTAILRRGITVVPVLNPDGVNINILGKKAAASSGDRIERLSGGDYSHWNANARGVDLNHNFGAGWEKLKTMEREKGIFGPSPRQYGGPKAFSEPETRAICGFCSTFNVTRLYSLHSQGEEIFWYYGQKTPFVSRDIAAELSSSCGYEIKNPTGLASHGGLKDWYIENFSRPGFTLEIGKGENPLPLSDFDSIYKKLLPALVKATVL